MSSEVFVTSRSVPWQEMSEGVIRQILGYDEQLMLVSVRFDKGAVGAAHQHPHRQVSFVAAGRFEVHIGEQKQVLEAGDCFIVPPNVLHGAVALEAGALVDVFTPAREDFVASLAAAAAAGS